MTARPVIAVSMGDPAGIGPEVIVKAVTTPAVARRLRPLIVGDLGVLRETARRLRAPLQFGAAGKYDARGTIPVREVSALNARERVPGRPTTAGAEAAHQAIVTAVRMMQASEAAALVTAPISKANIVAAGHRDFAGHTELLAEMTGAPQVRMMMAGPRLRVVLVTTHVALRRVASVLTSRAVAETIAVTDRALRRQFGIAHPRIAVCGVNPHAGEGGLFGREDLTVIAPAVRSQRRRAVGAAGPLPADTVFAHAAHGTYDAVICMYHDQGLAPFKLLHFKDGVNVTLGLPFVRTSPDHGTAFDIAGKGTADPSSMIAALELAARLATTRTESAPLRARAAG